MITRTGGSWIWEYTGLSTDTKPVYDAELRKIPNGSTFFEMDTGDVYLFDFDTKTWLKI